MSKLSWPTLSWTRAHQVEAILECGVQGLLVQQFSHVAADKVVHLGARKMHCRLPLQQGSSLILCILNSSLQFGPLSHRHRLGICTECLPIDTLVPILALCELRRVSLE